MSNREAIRTGGIDRPMRRLASLDVLRGIAVAGMVFVVSAGSWDYRYSQLKHADWNGATLADMVFPIFLFAVGVSLALSLTHLRADAKRLIWLKVICRAASLIVLGLILNALPTFDLRHLRIPGILQRIALCYLAGAALCLVFSGEYSNGSLTLRPAALVVAIVALLAGYWALLCLVPVPGFGVGRLDSYGNLAAYIDRHVFGVNHLWPYGTTNGVGVTYDPEGLLSTLPAITNVLLGVIAGWASNRRGASRVALPMMFAGLSLIGIGYWSDSILPLNKRIWTSTFAIFSGGFSLTLFSILSAIPAKILLRFPTYPLRVLGGNAILAFVISTLLSAIASMPILKSTTGAAIGPQQWAFELINFRVPDPSLASFVCALMVLCLIAIALVPLHRRLIFLRL